MSRNTEITFSARDNGVESTISRLRRSSNELGREMLQDANRFSSSAQDAIKYYEDQIRLIERRNKLDAQQQRFEAQSTRDELLGSATTDDERSAIQQSYRDRISEITEGTREDQIQVELLRELIETVKRTAQMEAHSDNAEGIREEMRAERRTLDDAGTEFTGLADRYRDELQSNQAGTPATRGGGFIDVMESGVGIANNPSLEGAAGLGQSAISKAGPYGRAAAAVLAAGVASFLAMSGEDASLTDLSSITGRGLGGLKDDEYGLGWSSALNMGRDEFIQRSQMTARASGSSTWGNRDLETMTFLNIQLEKAFGLQAGMSDEISVLSRTLTDTFDSRDFMGELYSAMYDTGVMGTDNNDMARMDAIVSTATSLASDQLMRSGATQMGDNFAAMRALMGLGGAFNNDQYAQSVLSGVDRGLSQAGGAETQALKYNLLRQLNPNADVFDLETMMEQGLATEGYLSSVMDMVRNMTTDATSQKILLSQLLPGVDNAAIKEMIENPDFNLETYEKRDPNISGRQDMTYSAALELQKGFADNLKETIADLGNIVVVFDGAVNKMASWFGSGASNNTGN